jgi:undecaprenyl-diphosphatase
VLAHEVRETGDNPGMTDLLAALLLGIIEGITEFLPISSTGHLLIAEHWLGARSDLFNIAIQAGAILAVVVIYWQRLWSLLVGFAQKANRDYALKLIVAFGVTGALGLVVKKLGFELPETLAPVAWALLVGGFVILGVEAIDARRADLPDNDPDAIGWGTAVLVGLAQVLAGVFPGTSRSAAAIFAALLFGRSSRVAATEFAFLVGIPTMFAATGYELLHTLKGGGAAGENWTALGVAFVVSALTAFAAVKWLLHYIQTHRFTVFAWYRIALGAALLAWSFADAAPRAAVASDAPTVERSARGPAAGSSGFVAPQSVAAATSAFDTGPGAGPSSIPGGARSFQTGASDADVARFRQEKLCVQAAMLRPYLSQVKSIDDMILPPSNTFTKEMYQDGLVEIRTMFDLVDRADGECSPKETQQLKGGQIYDTALRAANAGDEMAAACYVGGAFPMSAEAWKRPGVQARFRIDAERLMDRGIQRGDWSMVTLALMARNPKAHWREWIPDTPAGDPGMALVQTAFGPGDRDLDATYRLAFLKNLGSSDGFYDSGFLETTAAKLGESKARAAEAWARDAFQRYFQGRQWTWKDNNSCPL